MLVKHFGVFKNLKNAWKMYLLCINDRNSFLLLNVSLLDQILKLRKELAVFPTFKGKFEYWLLKYGGNSVYTHYRIFTEIYSCAHFTILVVIIMIHIVLLRGKVEGTLLVFGPGNSFRTCILCPLNANHVLP